MFVRAFGGEFFDTQDQNGLMEKGVFPGLSIENFASLEEIPIPPNLTRKGWSFLTSSKNKFFESLYFKFCLSYMEEFQRKLVQGKIQAFNGKIHIPVHYIVHPKYKYMFGSLRDLIKEIQNKSFKPLYPSLTPKEDDSVKIQNLIKIVSPKCRRRIISKLRSDLNLKIRETGFSKKRIFQKKSIEIVVPSPRDI